MEGLREKFTGITNLEYVLEIIIIWLAVSME